MILKKCWPEARKFVYSNYDSYLVDVVKKPNVPEVLPTMSKRSLMQQHQAESFCQEDESYLKEKGVTYERTYEWLDIRTRHYTPDFILENGIVIETKGRFVSNDRRKHE